MPAPTMVTSRYLWSKVPIKIRPPRLFPENSRANMTRLRVDGVRSNVYAERKSAVSWTELQLSWGIWRWDAKNFASQLGCAHREDQNRSGLAIAIRGLRIALLSTR